MLPKECEYCGCDTEHRCSECDEEITLKVCKENEGLCNDCSQLALDK